MPYNPNIHHRRSIRLKGYDYSKAGLYFITICCQDMQCRFGKIDAGESLADTQMILNEYGMIAYDEWGKLPERFSNFELDVFQIMPNHMHGIIVLNDDVGAPLAGAQIGTPDTQNENGHSDGRAQPDVKIKGQPQATGQPQVTGQPQGIAPTIKTNAIVGDIVGAYKSLVANACLEIHKTKNEMMGKLWQRNYYEHIIRNEQSYRTISDYIFNNPAKWKDDKFYTK